MSGAAKTLAFRCEASEGSARKYWKRMVVVVVVVRGDDFYKINNGFGCWMRSWRNEEGAEGSGGDHSCGRHHCWQEM